jgi:hypothetical protein
MSEQKQSYMQGADAWLIETLKLQDGESDEQWLTRVKTAIKQKLLESYRNGKAAGPAQGYVGVRVDKKYWHAAKRRMQQKQTEK